MMETLVLGVLLMSDPNPSANPGQSGVVWLHNEQGDRSTWKHHDSGSWTTELGYPFGASCGLATKGMGFDVEDGIYSLTLIIDGHSSPADKTIDFIAGYAGFTTHLSGLAIDTFDGIRMVPHNEQGRVSFPLGEISAEVLNNDGFGVWFGVAQGNDSAGYVHVTRIGVIAEKVN